MKWFEINPECHFVAFGDNFLKKVPIICGRKTFLKFDKNKGDDDKIFIDNDITIAVEKKSFLYLAGTILEFSGGLNGKGFVFNNPNATRTCGCGESFSL